MTLRTKKEAIDDFETRLVTALAAGTANVNVELRGVGGLSATGANVLLVLDAGGNRLEELTAWTSISGSTLIAAQRSTGKACPAESMVQIRPCKSIHDNIHGRIDDAAADAAAALAAAVDDVNEAMESMEGDLQEAIDGVQGTVSGFWDRTKQTLLDCATLALKVYPPDWIDDANGDTLPPLRPDGSRTYSPAAPEISFNLVNGQINAASPTGDWANGFSALAAGGRCLAALFRSAVSGAYKLLLGAVVYSGNMVANTSNTTAYSNSHVRGRRRQNNSGGAVTPLVVSGFRLGGPVSYRVAIVADAAGAPDLSDVYAQYPAGGGMAYTGDSLPILGPFYLEALKPIPAAAKYWPMILNSNASKSVTISINTDNPIFPSDADAAHSADGITWTTFSSYDLRITVSFAPYGVTLDYPATPEGYEEAGLVGSLSHPFVRDTTTTLVPRTYSEVSADTYASAPSAGQCPVAMCPPPRLEGEDEE